MIDSGLVVAMDSDWGLMVNLDWVNVTNSYHAVVNDSTVVKWDVVSSDVTAYIDSGREMTIDSVMMVVVDSDRVTTRIG